VQTAHAMLPNTTQKAQNQWQWTMLDVQKLKAVRVAQKSKRHAYQVANGMAADPCLKHDGDHVVYIIKIEGEMMVLAQLKQNLFPPDQAVRPFKSILAVHAPLCPAFQLLRWHSREQ
jgi:hypothetical protein